MYDKKLLEEIEKLKMKDGDDFQKQPLWVSIDSYNRAIDDAIWEIKKLEDNL